MRKKETASRSIKCPGDAYGFAAMNVYARLFVDGVGDPEKYGLAFQAELGALERLAAIESGVGIATDNDVIVGEVEDGVLDGDRYVAAQVRCPGTVSLLGVQGAAV